jgi:hypothetical protein
LRADCDITRRSTFLTVSRKPVLGKVAAAVRSDTGATQVESTSGFSTSNSMRSCQ